MKRKGMLMMGLCGVICLCIAGFTHGDRSANVSEIGKNETVIEDVFFNDVKGSQISTDEVNRESQSDDKTSNSDSQIEWWTAIEYENWIAEQKKEMMNLIDTGNGWYDGQGVFHEFTQESVDAVIAEYQEILKAIKNGMMYSKSTDDGDSCFMIPPSEEILLEGSISEDAIKFWEYDEFRSWMEEEKKKYDKLVEEKAIFRDNQTGEDRVWTQKDVDEMYNAWIIQLGLMEKGYKYIKPIETDTGGLLTGAMQPDYTRIAVRKNECSRTE